MTCTTCGAELPADAKFCHVCGTKVDVVDEAPTEVVAPVEAEQPEEEPATEVLEPVEPEPVAAVDDTETGISSPVLQAASMPTPRRERERRPRRPLEERGTFEEFAAAIAPLLRAPRFTGNLLAALVALLISIAFAIVLWALTTGTDWMPQLLPSFVDADRDDVGAVALFTFVLHQVPFVNDDVTEVTSPMLLLVVPLLACVAGLLLARRVMPCSGRGSFWSRTWPFAASYGVLCCFWSLVGAQDWHAAHLRALVYGAAIAPLGAWLHDRFVARRTHAATTATTTTGTPGIDDPTRTRLRRAAVVASRVFGLMLLVGAIGWLVGAIIEAFNLSDGEGSAILISILSSVEYGFKAVGFGVLAEGDPFGFTDAGKRIYEYGDVLTTGGSIFLVGTSFLVVLVGGLFSGFSIARATHPRSRNDHALYGAVTGVVWAVAMLLAQLFVLSRRIEDGDVLASLDGVQSCCFALIVGAVLGALGGLLAASAYGERIAEAVDEVTPDVVD